MSDDPIHDHALAEAFAAYAADKLGASNLGVTALSRIHGGASRETYSVDIAFEGADGPETKGLIFRRDPPDSLIDTERRVEFAAIRSMAGADLPAPEALFLEADGGPLGAPFFVMGRIEGGQAANPFQLETLDPHRARLGEQFFRHLGTIASVKAEGSPLSKEIDVPAPDACWRRELDYWEGEIDKNARGPEPIAKAAIRHLRRNPPPPAQKLAVVHGDFRTGNFLHDGAGNIVAVLDWEMAHIGDPYEDLAWATDALWCGGDQERAAGFTPWPEAIALWQEASGCVFDPAAFEWWSIFAHVKAIAIWISSARAYADGENDDPILAWSGWFTHAAHEMIISARLAPLYMGEA
ncbi:MAG: phosphotransferase family protein [Pseudomonadota bacterium]